MIRRTNQFIHSGFFESQIFKKHLFLFISFQFCNIRFNPCTNNQYLRIFILYGLFYSFDIFIAINDRSLIHIANIQHRLTGQQLQILSSLLLQIVQNNSTGRKSFFQSSLIKMQDLNLTFSHRVSPCHCPFLLFLQTVFNCFKVFQLQFRINNLFITYRVNATIHMDNIIVVKTTQHMNNSICFTDIRQKFISQSLTFTSSLHQSGNIYNFNYGRYNILRLY